MGLQWRAKWHLFIIKVSFECRFFSGETRCISLIWKFGLQKLSTKRFLFWAAHVLQCEAHITQHFTPTDSVCTQTSTVSTPAVGVHCWISTRSRVIMWTVSSPGALKSSTESAADSYPIDLPLWDAMKTRIKVQVLLSGEETVQCVHLRTVADVNSLVAAFHDVYQPPGETHKKRQVVLDGSYRVDRHVGCSIGSVSCSALCLELCDIQPHNQEGTRSYSAQPL